MPLAHVALGSNVGDRSSTLSAAVRRLRAEPGARVRAVSAFYETAPVGCPAGAGEFLNAALALETDLPPLELLKFLHAVERAFGRVRAERNAPRTLDLDVLFYEVAVLNAPELELPHPRLHERAFVLVPLAEIAPDFVHPVLKRTVRDLAQSVATPDVRPAPLPPLPQTLGGIRALVTGSTTGIGAAIADEFEARGALVVRHGRATRDGRFVAADLRDAAQTDRLAAEAWDALGGLDVLVCNAGADTLTGDAAKWDFDAKLDALLAVDLKATMRLSRALGARMKERGRGCVLTVGWDQAETGMEGDSGQLFAAVKGAVTCFTRSLALALAPEVRVNCIAPGWIRTAWGETASAVWQERVRRETPAGVWGLPEDVAEAAAWLAGPSARFVTGQTVRVNGGAIRA
jgi:3-oxoacyl-[acyl-carrier protein] reductase